MAAYYAFSSWMEMEAQQQKLKIAPGETKPTCSHCQNQRSSARNAKRLPLLASRNNQSHPQNICVQST